MNQIALPHTLPAFHFVDAVATSAGFAEFVVTDEGKVRTHGLPSSLEPHEVFAVMRALEASLLALTARAETGEWE